MSDPTFKVEGTKLIITMDCADAKKAPLSQSMKSRLVGSTHGATNISVGGQSIAVSVNAYIPATGKLGPTETERAEREA